MDRIFWAHTHTDIKDKLRVFLAQKQAEAVQMYQTLSLIAGQVFGGGKSKESSEDVQVPQTESEMLSAFGSVFGK